LAGGKADGGRIKESRHSWSENVDNHIPQMGREVWHATEGPYLQ